MRSRTLIIPGYHGSADGHWQRWLASELPDSHIVGGIDWDAPVLARWARAIRAEIDTAGGVVWLVAHSFGCLAALVAATDRADRVAGALLVAPANPERFDALGLRRDDEPLIDSITPALPASPPGFPSALVASRDDPWMKFTTAALWAQRWGSRLIDLGCAGHINPESGFGPWPGGLALLGELQQAHDGLPLGALAEQPVDRRLRPDWRR